MLIHKNNYVRLISPNAYYTNNYKDEGMQLGAPPAEAAKIIETSEKTIEKSEMPETTETSEMTQM